MSIRMKTMIGALLARGGGTRQNAGSSPLAAHAGLSLGERGFELLSAAAVDVGDRFAHRAGERLIDGAGFAAVVDRNDAGRAGRQATPLLLPQAFSALGRGEFPNQAAGGAAGDRRCQ